MTNPTPLVYPDGTPVGNTFTAYMNADVRERLAAIASFLALYKQPYNPAAILAFMLDAAEKAIQERMKE